MDRGYVEAPKQSYLWVLSGKVELRLFIVGSLTLLRYLTLDVPLVGNTEVSIPYISLGVPVHQLHQPSEHLSPRVGSSATMTVG